MLCQGYIAFGDGTKDLDGSGGNFEIVITVGGQTIQASPEVVAFGTEVRSAVWTEIFPVPANTEVVLKAKSPNGADTDVDVTAYLYDIAPAPMVSDILAGEIEGTYTLQQTLRIVLALMAGKVTGGRSNTITYRDTGDSKDRVTLTVDHNGNRSSVSTDVS